MWLSDVYPSEKLVNGSFGQKVFASKGARRGGIDKLQAWLFMLEPIGYLSDNFATAVDPVAESIRDAFRSPLLVLRFFNENPFIASGGNSSHRSWHIQVFSCHGKFKRIFKHFFRKKLSFSNEKY
jgi:hypothetical protein